MKSPSELKASNHGKECPPDPSLICPTLSIGSSVVAKVSVRSVCVRVPFPRCNLIEMPGIRVVAHPYSINNLCDGDRPIVAPECSTPLRQVIWSFHLISCLMDSSDGGDWDLQDLS